MLTFPITTPYFHSRVLSVLSNAFSEVPATSATGIRSLLQIDALSPADTQLTPDKSISSIIGTTSSWIDLGSPDPIIANISRQILKLELAYAAFCGVGYIIIHGPRQNESCDVVAYARAILDGLNQGPYMQLYLWMDTHPDPAHVQEQVGDLATFARREFVHGRHAGVGDKGAFHAWQAWDEIRTVCKYSTRLNIALSIPKVLPQPAVLSRWYSEPIRILTLDANTFRRNAKGYPALPSEHQEYILKLMKLKVQPWLILCNTKSLQGPSAQPGEKTESNFPPLNTSAKPSSTGADSHLKYMRHLQTKQSKYTAMDAFGAGYQDYLQAPLQPLTVNLESITYEVFEKDPIKYDWYEKAVARALHDWIEQGKPTSNPDGRIVVAVVGAGRGPLVTRALKAAEDVDVDIDMWALEKNPNAFVLLQRHNESKWSNKVNLVKSDMRTWLGPQTEKNLSSAGKIFNVDPDEAEQTSGLPPPESLPHSRVDSSSVLMTEARRYKIDILISELLGSFADNELSPECLDGVQHLLNPVHGISIPRSYTAHFTPVAAPKLHADISLSMVNVNPTAAEIPYVVMLDQVDFLSTTTPPSETPTTPSPTKPPSFASLLSNANSASAHQRSHPHHTPDPTPIIHTAWSFTHPNPSISSPPSTNTHNARYTVFSFPIPHPGSCHGLAGYFETVLYPGVELSTNPLTMDAKSEGMISWFPIFFPFKSPLFLPEGGQVEASMWRMTDEKKVW